MKAYFRRIFYRLRIWLEEKHKRLKSFWARFNRHLGKMWVRFVVLFVAVIAGWFLGEYFSPFVLGLLPENVYGDTRTVVGTIPFTLPMFLVLWWFRTYDSFQSNLRANFEAGIDHIASNSPNRIEIGTVMLISISETTSSYNRQISAAFIRRLNQSPAEPEANRKLLNASTGWGYAQLMFGWLMNQNEKFSLHYMDLRNQSFVYQIDRVTVCDVLNVSKGGRLTLEVAHCNADSMSMFFGCCGYARAQFNTVTQREQLHYNALSQFEPESERQHRAMYGLPSNKIEVEGQGCDRKTRYRAM